MGWLKWKAESGPTFSAVKSTRAEVKLSATADHVEHVEAAEIDRPEIDIKGRDHPKFPFQPVDFPDDQLPFIPCCKVQASKIEETTLWIVVDDIVYDCTEFVDLHPGGRTVIDSFQGEDCSWQFWRFHSKDIMRKTARPLRVGRTQNVPNRFPERPRFVGLRRLAADEDE